VELILAIVGAGPIGFFTHTRRRGLAAYLVLWAIVFPIQAAVVFSAGDDNSDPLYWVFNALILCLGIGLGLLGSMLGERRRARAEAAAAAASAA
jgi:peptidoglycan/LPS O-acetylase OafA/YrhL